MITSGYYFLVMLDCYFQIIAFYAIYLSKINKSLCCYYFKKIRMLYLFRISIWCMAQIIMNVTRLSTEKKYHAKHVYAIIK